MVLSDVQCCGYMIVSSSLRAHMASQCAPINDHTPTEEYKYWEDAVSANFHLGDAYFREPHTYRLEWQPGKQGGYLEWYLDGDLMMGVEAESLMTLTVHIIMCIC